MSAEIVSIGAELVSGANLDTNSQWLSRELEAIGWSVTRHTALNDDMDQIATEFRVAAQRSRLIVVTGGLGPTLDDLTREALAVAFGQQLVTDESSLQQIRNLFAARGREMPERNHVQARRPEFSEALPNSCGTAPGILMRVAHGETATAASADSRPDCLIVVMPGVPAEMKPMFDQQVRRHLTDSGVFIHRSVLRTFGYGESDAERLLGDLTARGRNPEVGITASEAVISLSVTARSNSEAESRRLGDETRGQIRERLGSAVYAEGNQSLQDVVADQLRTLQKHVSLAERSTTGGMIACWMTESLQNGKCLATAEIRPPIATQICHPVAEWTELARTEAKAILDLGKTDFVLWTSDHSEVLSDQNVAMKRGWVAVVSRSQFEFHDVSISGNLAIFRQRAARTALNRLRLILETELPCERDTASTGH